MKELMWPVGIYFFLNILTPAQGSQQVLVEDREFNKDIRREVMLRNRTYKTRLTNKQLKMTMPVALPLFRLTEYALCSNKGMVPTRVGLQYESLYIEAFFTCGNSGPLAPWKEKKVRPLCHKEVIRSEAQETLCKELGLYFE